jgi:hypothetical protein
VESSPSGGVQPPCVPLAWLCLCCTMCDTQAHLRPSPSQARHQGRRPRGPAAAAHHAAVAAVALPAGGPASRTAHPVLAPRFPLQLAYQAAHLATCPSTTPTLLPTPSHPANRRATPRCCTSPLSWSRCSRGSRRRRRRWGRSSRPSSSAPAPSSTACRCGVEAGGRESCCCSLLAAAPAASPWVLAACSPAPQRCSSIACPILTCHTLHSPPPCAPSARPSPRAPT